MKNFVRETDYSQPGEVDNLGVAVIKQAFEHNNLACFYGYSLSVLFLDEILLRSQSMRELHFSTARQSEQELINWTLLPSIADLRLCGDVSVS
mmetsp:Transcript_63021/g.111359  ORF Transcript_63021/g.111359 Transcript_63021/m.111359 type:complete len:93 (+) Transcript_63021:265-543(+)